MNRMNLAPDDYASVGLQERSQFFRELELNAPDDLDITDLIELYVEIEASLASDVGVVVQFIGATRGSGSEQIALDMAWAGSSLLGKKTLVLNCTRSFRQAIGVSADNANSMRPLSLDTDMAKVTGHEMYLADVRCWRTETGGLVPLGNIRRHLEDLRTYFDMVVLAAPPADSDPFGVVMARHVDSNVMILEAEKTRWAAAIRLREILSRSGGPILGAVLNDRRTYVPHWLS